MIFFALNASEFSEQQSLNASVVLRGIPQTSGPSPKGCFPPLSIAAGLKVSLQGRPVLPDPSRAWFEDVESYTELLWGGGGWALPESGTSCVKLLATNSQPVLTGQVGR